MAAKVYVGNLSWNTTDDSLAHAFSAFGQLTDYIVMKDRETGRSRGFGFVTFATQGEADAAIAALNEQELDGRRIRVNMANSRPAGGMGGGYGGVTSQYGANAYGGAGGYGGGYGGQPGFQPQQGGFPSRVVTPSRAATAATSSPVSSPSRAATLLPSRVTALPSRVATAGKYILLFAFLFPASLQFSGFLSAGALQRLCFARRPHFRAGLDAEVTRCSSVCLPLAWHESICALPSHGDAPVLPKPGLGSPPCPPHPQCLGWLGFLFVLSVSVFPVSTFRRPLAALSLRCSSRFGSSDLGTSTLVNSISFSPFSRTPVRLPMCLRDPIRFDPCLGPASFRRTCFSAFSTSQQLRRPAELPAAFAAERRRLQRPGLLSPFV